MKIRICATVFLTVFLIACGAKPGFTTSKKTLPGAPTYVYLDTKGNSYTISTTKLIYDPVSVDDTVDGIDDEGYHQELNISLNDYTKIAALCDKQFDETQKELPADYTGNIIPQILRKYPDHTDELTLSIEGVDEMDYMLIPYLTND